MSRALIIITDRFYPQSMGQRNQLRAAFWVELFNSLQQANISAILIRTEQLMAHLLIGVLKWCRSRRMEAKRRAQVKTKDITCFKVNTRSISCASCKSTSQANFQFWFFISCCSIMSPISSGNYLHLLDLFIVKF